MIEPFERMISRSDIQRLIHRPTDNGPIVSIFLDMSVNSDNKRTYSVFLNQWRARHGRLDSDRASHHTEPLGEVFERIERWLADEFDESNKGVAIYAELGGDWMEALQLSRPVDNRMEIEDRPVIGPLAELVEGFRHHGVMLVDREHMRMFSIYLGEPVREHEVRTHPYPTPHDVRRGGYSAHDYQKHKAEEVKQFFKEFAVEVREFDRRYHPDDLILLGTTENIEQFRQLLPESVRDKVVYTANAPVNAPVSEILERLEPYFEARATREVSDTVMALRDRIGEQHLAIAGWDDTLEQLQEGKVDTLVLARGVERQGFQCNRCDFYLSGTDSRCPYCGGDMRDGIDLMEAMIRMAEEQDIRIAFTEPRVLEDLDHTGGLLKF